MKRQALHSMPALVLAFSVLFAQQGIGAEETEPEPDWLKTNTESTSKASVVSHQASAEYSFVAGAKVRQGDRELGDTSEQYSNFNYTASVPVAKGWHLRLGVGWDRYSFGNPAGSPVPDTLQSTNLILGADVELSEKWIMRFEIQPGIYSDFENVGSDDFQVPAIVGFSYIVDSKLQWVMGVAVGYFSEYPVIPAAGVRWQFDDDWTLNLILPRPRLNYKVNEQLEAYVGANLKGGSYRVGNDFGTQAGNPKLNNAVVNYLEIRTGGGLSYKFHPAMTLELEGGWMAYRSFGFTRADTKISGEGSPYAEIGLKAAF